MKTATDKVRWEYLDHEDYDKQYTNPENHTSTEENRLQQLDDDMSVPGVTPLALDIVDQDLPTGRPPDENIDLTTQAEIEGETCLKRLEETNP